MALLRHNNAFSKALEIFPSIGVGDHSEISHTSHFMDLLGAANESNHHQLCLCRCAWPFHSAFAIVTNAESCKPAVTAPAFTAATSRSSFAFKEGHRRCQPSAGHHYHLHSSPAMRPPSRQTTLVLPYRYRLTTVALSSLRSTSLSFAIAAFFWQPLWLSHVPFVIPEITLTLSGFLVSRATSCTPLIRICTYRSHIFQKYP